jgi:hypothetical protein
MVDYKLRLGDGTTFSVDEKGLTTWLQGGLVDDKARVQPAGSKKWFSLKQVLAAQGAQRGHAERQTVKGRADVDRQAAQETAEIERKVAEQRAAEERKAAEDLAAAERKAEEDRTAAERKIIEEREAAVRRAAEERAAAEARAAAERQAEQERVEAERRAAEERAAAERSAAEAREAEAERLVAAERAERAERKRKAEEARLEAEQQAAENARLAAERKAAEERAAERKAAEDRAAAARRETEAREAAAREAERVAEAERLVAAERAERAERKRRADEERLAEQRAAEERAAAERRANEARAREREESMHAFHVSDLSEPPATEIAIEPAAAATEIAIEPEPTMVKVEDFERELGLNPVTFADGSGAPSARESPVPRTDRATYTPSLDRSESRPASRGEDAASRGVEPARTFVRPPTAVDNAVMRLLKVVDRGVVWVVRSLVPLTGDAVARSIRSLKSAGPKLTSAIPNLKSVAPKLKGLLARGAKPAEPASAGDIPAAASTVDPTPWSAPAPPPPPLAVREPPRAPEPPRVPEPPRAPLKPPPSLQKVDVIPFASGSAPSASEREEEVWDGEDAWEEPGAVASMFAVLWLWVKRVTIATALIVTTVALYLNKEKWLPQAESAAIVLGEGVDELSDRVPRTVPKAAIEAAHAEVPHLGPQTIELIMAKSTEGVLEPVEVFRRAHQAAERARPSLPKVVAAEIDHHLAAVAAELPPAEGEQLRSYFATVRAGTATAAYQDQEAAWLMARGVKRLPAERVARMQELFAQAITLALQPPV